MNVMHLRKHFSYLARKKSFPDILFHQNNGPLLKIEKTTCWYVKKKKLFGLKVESSVLSIRIALKVLRSARRRTADIPNYRGSFDFEENAQENSSEEPRKIDVSTLSA